MNYFDIDFWVLMALGRVGTARAETLLTEMSRDLGWMSTADNLASSLAALSADGYVTVAAEGEPLRADTEIALTEKGRGMIQIGGMAKVFAGMKYRAIRKNEKGFCALARPAVPPLAIDRASFSDYAERVARDSEVIFLMMENAEDGLYTLSLNHAYCRETDEEEVDTDAAHVLCDLEELRRMLGDLLDTARLLLESRKTRKLVLSGNGKAFVVTFCEVADESGYSVMRVTAAPILFNRQRFVGKRDSDLDYAQCGANALSTTFDSAAELCGCILGGVSRRTDLLSEELGQKIHELYEKI